MKVYFVIALINICIISVGLSQPEVKDFKSIFKLEMKSTSEKIVIDGILDESTWQNANVGSDFWQKVPYFAQGADPKTEVMLTFNDEFLYVAARCWQKEDIIVQSLKRDEYWDNDGIAIILDPLNTRTNAFIFGTTAAGAQWDALRSLDDINTDWSNKWYNEVHITDEYWSMEMAIPLKIIRFNENGTEWGMNFVRNHMNENEYHNWTAVPESFWPPDPAFAGNLIWETPPKAQKGNYNLIPFVTSSVSKTRGEKSKLVADVGLDARVAVTPTLNLDLTLNPDFSQIEVDELVTNLTRFSIFLPEKRTFFLENSDLFADYGYPAVRPFFSRTIGLDRNRQAVPILYGARLTGNITNTLRLGAMNIHSLGADGGVGQNQSAISVQKMFGRSFVKGMIVNRQAFDGSKSLSGDYGRNTSLEAAYVSDDGQISTWAGIHHAFGAEIDGKRGFYTGGFTFTNPNWDILVADAVVQDNYRADLGFVLRVLNYDAENDRFVRLGYNEAVANVTYRIRPREGIVTRHNFAIENTVFHNLDGTLNEWVGNASYVVAFRSTAEMDFSVNHNKINLLFPFRFVDGSQVLPSQVYDFNFVNGGFRSDNRKMISYGIEGRTGGFYNGKLHQASGNVNFRVQPWGNLGIGYQWNKLDFPDEYGNETITALLAKMEIGFNRNLLWTTLFQYIDQSEFMGVNSRIQWRFAPMSDLFLVYVDNYDVLNGINVPNQIQNNNRALVLKVNYWY